MKNLSAVILLNLFVLASLHNVCVRPQLHANINVKGLQRFYNPGSTVTLNCIQGFVPILGPRKIVCSDSGQWSKTSIQCIARRCPSPQLVSNGELHYEDTVFQSTINYTCHEGYTMTGSNTSECLANGMWSSLAPICSAVQCGLAPIPVHGMIVYDKSVRGNKTHYGTEGTYTCLPPYVLMGGARAACTASGTWSETPECKLVTCPPPEGIERGFVSGADQSQYGYMEAVVYGCHDDFVLDGNLRSICQQDGQWSEKPSCNEPSRTRYVLNRRSLPSEKAQC
ncbi:beta-2-glycoprotein 1-like isoform X2 [Nelusetta ayraudi]|uniref:beta-2-glycoprotein 1-like isoform X2 n=1 Tax=Nelusetta ayraudi TaxID=303726 RepID=UPI003F729A3C